MILQEHKKKLLKTNQDFKREWESSDLWFEIKQLFLDIKSKCKKILARNFER